MRVSIPVQFNHAGTLLTGQAVAPDGTGPFPTVMVMHNALGIGAQIGSVLQQLAELGYLAIATDMYGGGAAYGDEAVTAAAYGAIMKSDGLLRQRTVAWFDHLRTLPQVDPNRIAAIGYCFGGNCVLELARSGAELKAVVAFHGILTTSAPAQPGMVKAEVAAYCGARDPFAPLDHIEALRAEMAAAGAHHAIMIFGEAQHSFTDPNADARGRPGIAYNAIAAKVSWAGAVALLGAALGT